MLSISARIPVKTLILFLFLTQLNDYCSTRNMRFFASLRLTEISIIVSHFMPLVLIIKIIQCMKPVFLLCFFLIFNCNFLISQIPSISTAPVFSMNGGFYAGSQSVELTGLSPATEIRYTINGKEPDSSSTMYTGPVTITKTTALRAQDI